MKTRKFIPSKSIEGQLVRIDTIGKKNPYIRLVIGETKAVYCGNLEPVEELVGQNIKFDIYGENSIAHIVTTKDGGFFGAHGISKDEIEGIESKFKKYDKKESIFKKHASVPLNKPNPNMTYGEVIMQPYNHDSLSNKYWFSCG